LKRRNKKNHEDDEGRPRDSIRETAGKIKAALSKKKKKVKKGPTLFIRIDVRRGNLRKGGDASVNRKVFSCGSRINLEVKWTSTKELNNYSTSSVTRAKLQAYFYFILFYNSKVLTYRAIKTFSRMLRRFIV